MTKKSNRILKQHMNMLKNSGLKRNTNLPNVNPYGLLNKAAKSAVNRRSKKKKLLKRFSRSTNTFLNEKERFKFKIPSMKKNKKRCF